MSTVLDGAFGKLLELVTWCLRKVSFSWRIAWRARAEATESGYSIPFRALRRVVRKRVVKTAVRRGRTSDITRAKHLLAAVGAVDRNGEPMAVTVLFELLRTGYLGAAEQADRDLVIRSEVNGKLDALAIDGGARESLWRADIAGLTRPLARDATALRQVYGDGVAKIVHEVVNSEDRIALLRSWADSRPNWIPAEGRVFGSLGELAFEMDARAIAVKWFEAAITASAAPIDYWRVRRVLVDETLSPTERGDALKDIRDHPVVLAMTAPEFSERLRHMRAWDATSAMQRSFRMAIIVDYLVSLLELDEAIEVGVAAYESDGFAGAGTNAVEAYLRRSIAQPGSHPSDLSAGLSLALRIRDARRMQDASTGLVASKAIKAAVMLSDPERALALSKVPEATPAEAAHPEVRREAVVALTLLGNVEGARALIDHATPTWVRLQLEAREAELTGDQQRANELLGHAIDAAEDPNQKAPLAFRLASRGVVHPFVEQLRARNPETAEDIELVAALFNTEDGAEEQARHLVTERASIAFPLIEFFETAGRRRDVIFVAEQAAVAWNDPELWLKSARTHYLEGSYADAADRATKALAAADAEWGSRADAYILQIQATTASGDWASARVAARALIRLRPASKDARWALVRIHRNSGDVDRAYQDWKAVPGLVPRTADEAAVWLEFFRVHGGEMATLQELFDIATQFSSNQHIRNLVLGAYLGAPALAEPIEGLDFGTLLAQFERDYPGQQGIQRISVGDDANAADLLSAIRAAIAPRGERIRALNDGLGKGTIPVGFAARPNGRQVAELINLLHRSPRFAGTLAAGREDDAITDALASGCVIDVTALFTLALIAEQHAGWLTSKIPRVVTASEQMLDASGAREVFHRTAGGSLFMADSGESVFRATDPIEHQMQRLHADRLVELFKKAERQAARPLTSAIAKSLDGDNEVWLTALDLATKIGIPLWCDDAATRVIAEQAGASTFSTPALVEHLRRKAGLTARHANAIDTDLIHNFTVGVEYRAAVYEAAGQLDQMAPLGLAAAIRYGGAADADTKISFIIKAMSAVSAYPEQVADWTAVAMRYLADITDAADSQLENRSMFLHRILIQPWLTPSLLVFVVGGGRNEVESGWAEVLHGGMKRMLAQVSAQTDRGTASKFVLALIAQLEESDRQAALMAVLSN